MGLTWEKKHKKCRVEFKEREREESEGIKRGKRNAEKSSSQEMREKVSVRE